MKLIDVEIEVINDFSEVWSTIKLIAKFEDLVNDFLLEITLKDWIRVDWKIILDELRRIQTEHPFFKLRLCESPIELKFFVYSLKEIPDLKPQVVVGPYRIDLALPEKKVALEFDGHDFHKTRQQRTYDARRDRYLQMNGWQVIRFTGTEVHQDVLGCIEEAKKIIENLQKI